MTDSPPEDDPVAAPIPDSTTFHLLRNLQKDESSAEIAWSQLLERCESNLRMLVRFRWSSTEPRHKSDDEDDLLQELWKQALVEIDRFEYRGPGSLQRWLATLLRFQVLSARKVEKRRPLTESELPRPEAGTQEAGLFDALLRSQQGVSRDQRRREREDAVAEVLASLPEESREAILLSVYEGNKGEEAAAQLEISASAFSKRLRKALELVRQRLPRDL